MPIRAHGFLYDTYDLSLSVFELFSQLHKRFCSPARPPVRPGYGDKYRSRSYRFVERRKRLQTVELGETQRAQSVIPNYERNPANGQICRTQRFQKTRHLILFLRLLNTDICSACHR